MSLASFVEPAMWNAGVAGFDAMGASVSGDARGPPPTDSLRLADAITALADARRGYKLASLDGSVKTTEALAALCAAVAAQNPQTLRVLSLRLSSGVEDAEPLVALLETNAALEVLYLGGSDITSGGIKAVGTAWQKSAGSLHSITREGTTLRRKIDATYLEPGKSRAPLMPPSVFEALEDEKIAAQKAAAKAAKKAKKK